MKLNAISLGIILAAGLRAQSIGASPEGFPDLGDPCCVAGGVPRTIEQMLERRGVQLTEQALVYALLDSNPVIRSLAGEKLAQDKDKDALPSIITALNAEKAPGTLEIMAFALASPGEMQGFETLRSIRTAGSGLIVLRMRAAEDLLSLHDESCVDSLLSLIRSVEAASPLEPLRNNLIDVGLYAFSVYQFQHLQANQVEEIRALAVRSLVSKAAGVRLAAARALGKFPDASSIGTLQKALEAETDQFNRTQIPKILKQLEDGDN